MKTKPIIFNTEMVKAILDGRKTQTRRSIELNIKKDNKAHSLNGAVFTIDNKLYFEHNLIENFSKYKVGDALYVKETWCYGSVVGEDDGYGNSESWLEQLHSDIGNKKVFYKADMEDAIKEGVSFENVAWKPSIHMPKKYARIFLKVTNVRVERVQDITRKDVLKEGIKKGLLDMYKHYEILGNGFSDKDYDLNGKFVNGAICSFRTLWNSTSKDGYKFEDNPFVFVYEFERVLND